MQAEDDWGAFGETNADQEKPDASEPAHTDAAADDQEGAFGDFEDEQKQETAAEPMVNALDEPKVSTKADSEVAPAITEAPPAIAENQNEQDDWNNGAQFDSKPVEANQDADWGAD